MSSGIIASQWPPIVIPEHQSLVEYVFERQFGDRVAIVEGETNATISFAQLQRDVQSVAGGLQALNVKKGDVVAIVAANCIRYATILLAITFCGATSTTCNPAYQAREIEHQLKDSRASIVVTTAALCERVKEAAASIGGDKVRQVILLDVDSTDEAAKHGAKPFTDLLHAAPLAAQVSVAPKTDLAALPYSSGTTGVAKGVMLTHLNLIANVEQVAASGVRLNAETDTMVSFLPFFHVYGLAVLILGGLRAGVKQITLQRFDLVKFLQLNQEHKCTWSFIAPPVAVALGKHPIVDNYKLSLKYVLSGAAPLGAELQSAVEKRLGVCVMQGYGMTELSPVTHLIPMGQNRPGAAGKTVANTECKLVDVDGNMVPSGERGELCIRGPQVMAGYLNNPTETANTIDKDGFLHTGDIAMVDDDGYFRIVDRAKSLVKVSGFQVAPAELESILLGHPHIADCAVIGVPDEQTGEAPKAFIVKRGDATASEQEIKDWLKPHVATFKQLRQVEFIDAVPKSASGKILHRVLRDKEKEKLNGQK